MPRQTGILTKEVLHLLYYGPVSAKQRLAEELHARHRAMLLMDIRLNIFLDELKEGADQLKSQMTRMGMGEFCGQCAAEVGGGCCSLYMADEVDGIQMLINLLIGGQVGQVRNDGVECCFLSEEGCIFICKPMFCLNYNCKRIHDTASVADLNRLEELTGQLLGKQHEVEQHILAFLATTTR